MKNLINVSPPIGEHLSFWIINWLKMGIDVKIWHRPRETKGFEIGISWIEESYEIIPESFKK